MLNSEEIKDKLSRLRLSDPDFKQFGATYHRYELNEVLPVDYLMQFEKRNGISLPTDYFSFLTTIGNGGAGPYYGLQSLNDSLIDFKLRNKPLIEINKEFAYHEPWNAGWINDFNWEFERPDEELVNTYMDVAHIKGSLQICHFGHGCTYLLIIQGKEHGNIWFDGRADYGGIFPEITESSNRTSFSDWYNHWLDQCLLGTE